MRIKVFLLSLSLNNALYPKYFGVSSMNPISSKHESNLSKHHFKGLLTNSCNLLAATYLFPSPDPTLLTPQIYFHNFSNSQHKLKLDL